MSDLPFNAKWSFTDANDLRRAEDWLKAHAFGKRHVDLLGTMAMAAGSNSGGSIGVRYKFEREDDWRAFLHAFPDAASEQPDANGRSGRLAHGPTDGPTPTSTAPAARHGRDAFAEGAKAILSGPDPISAGKVHLLGLDKIKAHFGDQWVKRAQRAELLIERAIERRLTPRDVYQKTGPLAYVILFADLSDRDADFKCAKMAEEISRMLIGEDIGADNFEIQTVAAKVNGAALLSSAASPAELVHKLETVVNQEQERRLAEQPAALQVEEPEKPVDGLHFVYRPIWDVRRSVVVNFLCMPVRRIEGGVIAFVPLASPPTEDGRQDMDRRLLNRVIADFRVMDRKGHRLPICIPIHFDSVSSPSRRRDLLDIWQKIPREYHRRAIFEIIESPDGIPQARVAELANIMKPYSASVFLRIPIGTRSFNVYGGTGLAAIGAALGVASSGEERLIKELPGFAEGAEKARLRAYVHGLNSFSLTLAAITSGFELIDGDSISSVVERPEAAFRMNVEDLYAAKLARQRKGAGSGGGSG